MTSSSQVQSQSFVVTSPSEQHEQQEVEAELTFTCFPKLPPELRLKIWKLADGRRVLQFKLHSKQRTGLIKFKNQSGTPALLQVCHDSRQIALKHYVLGFEQKLRSWKPIYYSASKDTIVFNHFSEGAYFSSADYRVRTTKELNNSSITSIAIRRPFGSGWCPHRPLPGFNIDFLTCFTSLEELILVTPQDLDRLHVYGARYHQTCPASESDLQMFADAMTKELKERMPVRLGYSNNFNSGVRGVNWPVVASIWWNNPVIKLMTAEEFKDYEC
ncbi:hypothetical protein B0J14DRAFT_673036 [Halenospora varia]|nr:hypothetical protein B0J14DRAFT_673036 [Halenospora varia]